METGQAYLSQELNQKNPFILKPDQPGKHVLTCFWKYSYNTGDYVAREIRTFNCGKKRKQYYQYLFTEEILNGKLHFLCSAPPLAKKPVKVKTCNLPVVKIIQKALQKALKMKKEADIFSKYWLF